MQQWGFYFNQDRCLGCKACILACKNWNEKRRGDAQVNVFSESDYTTAENKLDADKMDNGVCYSNPETGNSNFELYRQFYMKENWRRVEATEKGQITVAADNTFETNVKRSYLSLGCNHCSTPACMYACPMGVIYKESEYGLVLYNNSACISCGKCKDACPWGATQFYRDDYANFAASDPLRPRMTKCTGCLERIRADRKPACVAACWNRALDAGPIDILISKYGDLKTVEGFKSDFIPATGTHTEPNIVFKEKK